MLLNFVAVVSLFSILLSPSTARAQDVASSMVGVWKVASLETKDVQSGKVTRPLGEPVSGTFIFTRGGRFSATVFGANRVAPAAANATEAERLALFNSLVAYKGTYRTEGNKLILKIENSHIQSWNGTERVLSVETDGKKIMVKSSPLKAASTGLQVVAESVWERLE